MDRPINTDSVIQPESTSQVVTAVQSAVANGTTLKVRSIRAASSASSENAHTLDLSKFSAVVDYPARDMTITVQAGMAVSELKSILNQEGQQLPIDACCPSTSVGALVAGDTAGPRQYGYGTLRDYVIGVEAVDGQGRVFHAGGRVVKNVAGYDLCRLMIGSRGSLGVLTQVTFKLKPLPEHTVLRTFEFASPAELSQTLDILNSSLATPVVLDFAFPTRNPPNHHSPSDINQRSDSRYTLKIGVEGSHESCQWQLDQLNRECSSHTTAHSDSTPDTSIEQYCADFDYARDHVRVRCLPSKVIAIASSLADQGIGSVGHAGSGVLYAVNANQNDQTLSACDGIAASSEASDSTWDSRHPARASDPLTARLRTTFDPHSVFAL